jgi:hypothetical protein
LRRSLVCKLWFVLKNAEESEGAEERRGELEREGHEVAK